MAYITVADLKNYLGVSGAGDDVLLESLIDRSKAIIDAYTYRTFEATSDTSRSFDSVRDTVGAMLYLDADLASITSITNGDGTTVTSAQYATEPRNTTPYYAIRLRASSGVAWESDSSDDPEDAVTVTGKWAFSTTAPADIVQACTRLAGYLYRQKDNAADLDRPIIAGNATILPSRLPSDVMDVLSSYRKRVK